MSRPAFYSQNDNQNYFVSNGRTSSRVLQQPGGSSSINLSWENHNQDDVKARSISNNSFARGSSQNTGNVLTERPSSMSRPAFYSQNDNQNYFVSNGKTSSRVLQQPGGSSSINLSWENHNQDDVKARSISNNSFASGSSQNTYAFD